MFKRILVFLGVLVLLCKISEASNLYHVGYEDINYPAKGRIWYPISQSIKEGKIPSSSLFLNYKAKNEVPLIETKKKLPLLILSHGNGSVVYRLNWVADYFARRGWIVAGINHPGNTFGDTSVRGFLSVWERPKHVSKLIDFMLIKHPFGSRIDNSKIAVVGHSAGGATALMLIGARMSKKLFDQPLPQCKPQHKDFDNNKCTKLGGASSIDFTVAEIEGNYKDWRVGAVVALDPGFARSFPHGQKTNKV